MRTVQTRCPAARPLVAQLGAARGARLVQPSGSAAGRCGLVGVAVRRRRVLAGVLAGALAAHGGDRLGPADQVTVTRGTLACVVAALTALTPQSDRRARRRLVLLGLTRRHWSLDAVDGWVARRTGTASRARRPVRHGGRCLPHPRPQRRTSHRRSGWWVLAIGALPLRARGRRPGLLPWLRRRGAAAVLAQGGRGPPGDRAHRGRRRGVLPDRAAAASSPRRSPCSRGRSAPRVSSCGGPRVARTALGERSRSHRDPAVAAAQVRSVSEARRRRPAQPAVRPRRERRAPARSRRPLSPCCRAWSCWVVLVAPDDPAASPRLARSDSRSNRSSSWRCCVVLPPRWRRPAGVVVGGLLGLLTAASSCSTSASPRPCGRPFDLLTDWTYLRSARRPARRLGRGRAGPPPPWSGVPSSSWRCSWSCRGRSAGSRAASTGTWTGTGAGGRGPLVVLAAVWAGAAAVTHVAGHPRAVAGLDRRQSGWWATTWPRRGQGCVTGRPSPRAVATDPFAHGARQPTC